MDGERTEKKLLEGKESGRKGEKRKTQIKVEG